MEAPRREATPVEIAALLMDAVCTPTEREQTALAELAVRLGVDLGHLQSELMLLRAFAVDFATAMTLGQTPARRAILMRIYQHWERLDREVGAGLLEDLQEHLALYGEAVGTVGGDKAGLSALVGRAFAQCCRGGEHGEDLALLGGSMFGAFFEEIADLLDNLDVALAPGEGEEEAFDAN